MNYASGNSGSSNRSANPKNSRSSYLNEIEMNGSLSVSQALAMSSANNDTSTNAWNIVTPDQSWSQPQSQSPSPQLPMLNGSPWHGGPPFSSPSPVGSRSSTSPPQILSAAVSPNSSNYSSAEQNNQRGQHHNTRYPSRRSSDSRSPDEPAANYQSGTTALNSRRSSDEQSVHFGQFGAIRRTSESRSSDDQTNQQLYQNQNLPSRNCESRSSDDQPLHAHNLFSPTINHSDLEHVVSQLIRLQRLEGAQELAGNLLDMHIRDDYPAAAFASPNRHRFASSVFYCNIHQDEKKFFCETCGEAFCYECGLQFHIEHATLHLMNAVKNAELQTRQVLTEAISSCATLQREQDNVQKNVELLEVQTVNASIAVRETFGKLARALEAREKELLNDIFNAHQCKLAQLTKREGGIRFSINRMQRTIENLSQSAERASLAKNPVGLYLAKDSANAQIFQIKLVRQNLPPPETNFISYHVNESSILSGIASLGNVIYDPGHVSNHHILSGYTPEPMAPPPICPRGRAIAGCENRIVVNRRRTYDNPFGKAILSLGNDGNINDNVCRPWGVACDKAGHIIIADRSNNRIQIYLEDGTFVRKFGSYGTMHGQFDRPAGVAVDSRRRIIVADKDNHRIQAMSMEGRFLMVFGEKGAGNGQFNYPWDVAVNDICQIVVSDTRNHRIQLFSPEGVFLRKFGFESAGHLWKYFEAPRGVAFNSDGDVIVTDFNNHRVIVVESSFLAAHLLGHNSLVAPEAPSKQLQRPQGVICDDDGNIIVADSRNHRIQILDKNGVCLHKFGTHGTGPDQLDRPSGVAITSSGKIAVVDFGNNRISVF